MYMYICKTQIHVLPSNPCPIITSYSDPCPSKALSPQICVLWCHTQIYVLAKTYLLRSVSSDVILRAMPPKYMFPQFCALWHNTQIKNICQKKYPHRSVSYTFWTERKKTFIAINSQIHIWDTHWLVPVCVVFSCNLWFYCSMHDSVHKTKNRPLDLFYTDCINPNYVTIRPSLYEILVFSFFYRLFSHGHLFHISVFFYLCDR
jgi:hypothetical protein